MLRGGERLGGSLSSYPSSFCIVLLIKKRNLEVLRVSLCPLHCVFFIISIFIIIFIFSFTFSSVPQLIRSHHRLYINLTIWIHHHHLRIEAQCLFVHVRCTLRDNVCVNLCPPQLEIQGDHKLYHRPSPNTTCFVHEMRTNLCILIRKLEAFEKKIHTSLVLLLFSRLSAKNMISSSTRS